MNNNASGIVQIRATVEVKRTRGHKQLSSHCVCRNIGKESYRSGSLIDFNAAVVRVDGTGAIKRLASRSRESQQCIATVVVKMEIDIASRFQYAAKIAINKAVV